MRMKGRPSSARHWAQRWPWRASSAQCFIRRAMSSPWVATRTMRPRSSAPSSSLWRYQLSFHARLRVAGSMASGGDAFAAEAFEAFVDAHDGGEVVLRGDGDFIDDERAEVGEGAGGV